MYVEEALCQQVVLKCVRPRHNTRSDHLGTQSRSVLSSVRLLPQPRSKKQLSTCSIAQPPSQPALADPNSDEEEPSEPLVRHRRSRPSETHAETSAGPFIAPGTLPPNIVQGSAVPSGGGITRFESPFDAEEEPPAFQRFGSSIQERDAGGANQGQPGRDAAVGVGGPVNDHNDVEEEMMRAALEASMKEHGGGPVADDEDLEKAISQSLRVRTIV